MRIRFHGVRGSIPVSGPDYVRAGGHTSCVSVARGDGLPTLVLDAGTGLLPLSRSFDDRPFVGAMLLTHLHWDHVHGLPFFGPADRPDGNVELVQPAQGAPIDVLERGMSPPHFPITPGDLHGDWTHRAIEPGRHRFGGFDVVASDVVHKGGRTFGYRIEAGGASCCYVPDAGDDNDDTIVELARDADLLIRGAPFVADEQERADAFGHGTIERAVAVRRRAGARRLVITHHGPHRTDGELEAIAAALGVEVATEGLVVDLGDEG